MFGAAFCSRPGKTRDNRYHDWLLGFYFNPGFLLEPKWCPHKRGCFGASVDVNKLTQIKQNKKTTVTTATVSGTICCKRRNALSHIWEILG